MALLDSLDSEIEDESFSLVRDRRGRLALSRPRARVRVTVRTNGTPSSNSTASTRSSGSSTGVKLAQPQRMNTTERARKSLPSEKSTMPMQATWGPAEDVRLLELQRDGKNWDYIEGKLDHKGKDMAALKARFEELIGDKEDAPESEKVVERVEKKTENVEKSPGKKDKNKKGEEKRAASVSRSDKGSIKGDENTNAVNGILKISSKSSKAEEKVSKKASEEFVSATKEGYIGKHGHGEVRFFNGLPVLYKHSGTNAEQLDAETVAMVHKEATKHDRSKWLTVVSRFFDKTGIRMDPEVARVALENS